MRLTKIYTRTGDDGATTLANGQRVSKDSLRIEVLGQIDELNTWLGVIHSYLVEHPHENSCLDGLSDIIRKIQNDLFDLSGDVAVLLEHRVIELRIVNSKDIQALEVWIDLWQKELKPLKEFILPGGGTLSSYIHYARVICRRAERSCVALHKEESINAMILAYLNRLSDVLFVMARWSCQRLGNSEIMWQRI